MIRDKKNSIVLSKDHRIRYEVFFTEKLFTNSPNGKLKKLCRGKTLIIIDKNAHKLYGKKIEKWLKNSDIEYKIFVFEATEKNKNMDTILKICDLAKSFRMKRDAVFIGIGGGITLDTVGFSAAIFRRKMNYIRIPTTLLGIVDAGVGVKVGVNYKNSKNLLGAYHAPLATFNDQSFLVTLSESEVRNGLYEIIKMGLCESKGLFELIEKNHQLFFKKNLNKVTNQINYLAASSMMHCLESNLHENNLKRKVDFGHTFSPFIEESTDFKIRHGEAVGTDMFISSYISMRRKLTTKEDFQRITDLFKKIGGLTHFKKINVKRLHSSLELVRDHRAGDLNLVLPTQIGHCTFTQKCSLDEIKESIQLGLKLFK